MGLGGSMTRFAESFVATKATLTFFLRLISAPCNYKIFNEFGLLRLAAVGMLQNRIFDPPSKAIRLECWVTRIQSIENVPMDETHNLSIVSFEPIDYGVGEGLERGHGFVVRV
jgi:hypothetical protein